MISHELWQSKLGAQPGIVGKPLRLNGELYTVVGVMPAGFEFLGHVDVRTPLAFPPEQLNRRFRNLIVVGEAFDLRELRGTRVPAPRRSKTVTPWRRA